MDVGFIGLGNLGEKLANSLLRNGINLSVIDLDKKIMEKFKLDGALICKNDLLLLTIISWDFYYK